jgi:hypothetical protein
MLLIPLKIYSLNNSKNFFKPQFNNTSESKVGFIRPHISWSKKMHALRIDYFQSIGIIPYDKSYKADRPHTFWT